MGGDPFYVYTDTLLYFLRKAFLDMSAIYDNINFIFKIVCVVVYFSSSLNCLDCTIIFIHSSSATLTSS